MQSGDLQIEAVHLHQHGLITLASAASSLTFLQDDLLNEGTIELSGGILNLGSNLLTNDSAGTIRGTGQIITSGLINEGLLAPGGSSTVGTLTITGDFINDSSGVLQIRADSSFATDILTVDGNANLDGTISFGSLAGHSYNSGQTYVAITASGATSGGFATVDGFGLLQVTPSYSSGAAFALSLIPGQIEWIGGDGDWSIASNWQDSMSVNRLPTFGDTVLINPTGARTVTVSAGTDFNKLNLAGSDDTLQIVTSGTVSLTGGDTLNGFVHVSGGTLNYAGNNLGTKAANDILITSGNINVNAALDVKNLTLQGGVLNIASGNSLTLTYNGNWNGTASISGGGTFQNAANSVLTIFGAGQRTMTGTNLINDGQIRLGMDTSIDKLELASGSVLTNNGTISATTQSLDTQVISGNGTLNNQGGTLLIEGGNVLHIQTGSLHMNGGNLDAGSSTGSIQIDATTAAIPEI